jgi:Flp pilus assembly protein TadG
MKEATLLERLRNTRGTVSVVVALMLLALIGFGSLAIDVGYMMVNRNELQNVADAAALASTRTLGAIYEPMTVEEQHDYVVNRTALVTAAQEVASNNFVKNDAGNTITINGADVIIGQWNPISRTLVPTSLKPDAVRVTVRKDSVANGPVSTFLAGVLGIGSIDVSATATASLTSLYKVPEDKLPLPVGISRAWFSNPDVYCHNPIRLYPTNTPEGCAGWNVYTDSPANAKTLRDILNGLTKGTYSSPETIAGQTAYNFTGGTIASDFDDMKTLFDTMRVKNDGVIDNDNDPNTWTTAVPVYDWPDCSNPNPRDGAITIVGFTTIVIKSVQTAPEKIIDAQVVCDTITNGSGGGEDFGGLVGSIPQLVQ